MVTVLPTPIEFRLPDDWRPAPPDAVGAPGAAFVALAPVSDAGFTANITVDGDNRPDSTSLAALADASVHILRSTASVTVVDRREVGSSESPGFTQLLHLTTAADGAGGDVERELVQAQVYLAWLDVHDPAQRAVIRLVLTATAVQYEAVLRDFQWFVSTVRPATPDGGRTPE